MKWWGNILYENGQFIFNKHETLPNEVDDILWQWYLYNYTLPLPLVLKDGIYLLLFPKVWVGRYPETDHLPMTVR